jgi:hypothetical protein
MTHLIAVLSPLTRRATRHRRQDEGDEGVAP